MSSQRPASSKRAAPPRACDYTRAFLADWERLSRSGRYDLKRLKEAMLLLVANDAPLGPELQVHAGHRRGTATVGQRQQIRRSGRRPEKPAAEHSSARAKKR